MTRQLKTIEINGTTYTAQRELISLTTVDWNGEKNYGIMRPGWVIRDLNGQAAFGSDMAQGKPYLSSQHVLYPTFRHVLDDLPFLNKGNLRRTP